jgi:hypothetical protein
MAVVKLDANSLRIVLSALRSLYGVNDQLYYSVINGKAIFESAGGAHRFIISFPVDGGELPLRKTSVGAFTQLLSILREYADLSVTGAAFDSGDLAVGKEGKQTENGGAVRLRLSKELPVVTLSDSERRSVMEGRDTYTGEKMFTCPASVGVAASKAHVLESDTLYFRGKAIYCMSGNGVCRVQADELDDGISTQLDAEFTYRVTRLGAESYDFYPDYATFEIDGVVFKLGMVVKETRALSQNVTELFDQIPPFARVYSEGVYALYCKGPLRVCADGTLLLKDGTELSAPFILPLSNDISETVIPEAVARAAGSTFTVGAADFKGRVVACVSGECDILLAQ